MRVSTVEPELRGLFKFSPGHPLIAIPLPAPSGCVAKHHHKRLHTKALHEQKGFLPQLESSPQSSDLGNLYH